MSADHATGNGGWPRWLRRGPMEMASRRRSSRPGIRCCCSRSVLTLYTWSFVTTLAGTALFIVVSNFPE